MLRVTHLIGIFSPEHGGPVVSLTQYARGQAAAGMAVRLRTVEGYRNTSPAIRLGGAIDQKTFALGFPEKLGRSAQLAECLRAESSPDVYHLHGAWLRVMYYGYREAKRRGRGYALEINGAYQALELQRKPWRKKLVRWWFQDRILREASCLHVNSTKEARELRGLGFEVPLAVIPAGFDIAGAREQLKSMEPECPWPELGQRPFVLYLARLHPNKGLDLLLRAWQKTERLVPDMLLLIVGTGEPAEVLRFRALATELGIAARCQWRGFVTEKEKAWVYAHARFYCLPSRAENFGNTVQEALGYGTPVLTTTETPWAEIEGLGCGWLAACNEEDLLLKLKTALDTPAEKLREMGRRGQALVESSYSLGAVVQKQIAMYRWLAGDRCPDWILK